MMRKTEKPNRIKKRRFKSSFEVGCQIITIVIGKQCSHCEERGNSYKINRDGKCTYCADCEDVVDIEIYGGGEDTIRLLYGNSEKRSISKLKSLRSLLDKAITYYESQKHKYCIDGKTHRNF